MGLDSSMHAFGAGGERGGRNVMDYFVPRYVLFELTFFPRSKYVPPHVSNITSVDPISFA
jgi:hypothetical protein